MLYDLFKHITTLSTGILLILITFLEKLFQTPTAKYLVGISFVCFTITIIFSLITMAIMTQGIADIGDLWKDENWTLEFFNHNRLIFCRHYLFRSICLNKFL